MNKITERDLHNMVMVIWSVDGKMKNITYNDMEDFNDFRPLENELVNIDQFKPNDQFFKYEFKNDVYYLKSLNEHDYYELLNSNKEKIIELAKELYDYGIGFFGQFFNEGMEL